MSNYYSTINDVTLTFSGIYTENNVEALTVRFERPNNNGFDFAEGKIPHFIFNRSCGFSEDELLQFEKYLKNNASLIWDLAREKDGGINA